VKRLTVLTACLLAAAPALASGAFESAYTKLDLANCQQEPLDPDDPVAGGTWWCQGYGGIPVRVAEGDLRFLVSFSANAAQEPAAGQTLPAFNTIGTTLEWRLRDEDGRMRPFATILRYTVDFDGNEAQYLVVTRLDGDTACHMAYVKASEPDHNALARQAADAYAPAFRCGVDEAFNVTSAGIDYGDRPGTPPRCPRE
jgi:hypothetical protein